MVEMRFGAVESRFADVVWAHVPMTTGELVKICEKEFSWKRTTTYTSLKRLCERGVFQSQDGIVTALISRDEFYAMQSEKVVEESFDGSLPAFIAAFTKRKSLSAEEVAEIRKLIDAAGKEG